MGAVLPKLTLAPSVLVHLHGAPHLNPTTRILITTRFTHNPYESCIVCLGVAYVPTVGTTAHSPTALHAPVSRHPEAESGAA